MSDRSTRLSLPFILPSQAQKHVTHNEALQQLDLVVQLAVQDRDRSAPPVTPLEADRHIVGSGASGDWAGHSGSIALFSDLNGWEFTQPQIGWQALVLSEAAVVFWDGTDWQPLQGDLDNLDGVGIGTSADAINRLAVSAPATLLSHDGAGHQLKINKAATGDTASLLFQTNWSGRAEMGMAGTDAFAIKVSADGATWLTGLTFSGATGRVEAPQGVDTPEIAGLAVQQSPDDVTPGRLMRADWGYGPGSLLGPVSESAGVPTGAVIEHGSNASGEYTRFADGTQICTGNIALNFQNSAVLLGDWVYPASFDGGFETVAGSVNAGATNGGVTPSLNDLGAVMWTNSGNNNTIGRLTIRSVTGAPSFQSGDQAMIKAVAFGRWF